MQKKKANKLSYKKKHKHGLSHIGKSERIHIYHPSKATIIVDTKEIKNIEIRQDKIYNFLEEWIYKKFIDMVNKLYKERQKVRDLIDDLNHQLYFEKKLDTNQNQVIPAIPNVLEVFE